MDRSQTRRFSAGHVETGDDNKVALSEVLAQPRYEVIPTKGTDVWVDDLPKEAKVTVTCSPAQGIEGSLRLTQRLAKRGFRVVPHIAARLVAGEAHLEEITGRLGDLGISEIFVIGGDVKKPFGPFSSAFELLSAMTDLGHGFEDIGVGGYPERHPLIDDDTLRRALLDKQTFATYVVSQMCFDPGVIIDWVVEIRRRGISLPVLVGVPGVVNKKKLLQISRRIGVGDSARFLRKHSGLVVSLLADLFRFGGYSPDGLVSELAPYVGDRDYGIVGLHFYTFNQVESAEEWRRRMQHPDTTALRREGSGGHL